MGLVWLLGCKLELPVLPKYCKPTAPDCQKLTIIPTITQETLLSFFSMYSTTRVQRRTRMYESICS